MSATGATVKRCTRCRGTGVEMDWVAFGVAVKAARTAKGWGLRETARRVGCSPAFISDVEHGRRGGGLSGVKTTRLLEELEIPLAVLNSIAVEYPPKRGQKS